MASNGMKYAVNYIQQQCSHSWGVLVVYSPEAGFRVRTESIASCPHSHFRTTLPGIVLKPIRARATLPALTLEPAWGWKMALSYQHNFWEGGSCCHQDNEKGTGARKTEMRKGGDLQHLSPPLETFCPISKAKSL